MKAVVCPRYGAPEVLQFADVPAPVPNVNEVRVRVRATTVTVADSRIRSFNVPRAFWLPARLALGIFKPRKSILGVEYAGDIDHVGEGVSTFQVGDPVYGSCLLSMGAYAEYVCLPAKGAIARKPAQLSYEEAAAIPIGAVTALHFLRKAKIKAGDHVLIYGASGSVGTYAIMLAKHFGATVTAVCSAKNEALVKSIGADYSVDYTKPDFETRLKDFDVVFVAIDKIPFDTCKRILKPTGVYLNITTPFKTPAMMWTAMTTKKRIFTGQNSAQTSDDLEFLNTLVEARKFHVVVDRNYPLDRIVEAHQYVDAGHKKGNVTVTIAKTF